MSEPNLAMPGWRSLFVTERDGLRLHVAETGDRAGRRLPIVCLPGLSRNVDDFDMIGRAIAGAGERRVIALDSRGRGGSQYDPDWRRYDLAVELDDLAHVLAALDIEGAIFLGTSRGGLLTMLMGAARPAIIRGVILNDIGPVIEARGLARIRSYIGRLPPPRSFAEGEMILRRVFGAQFTDLSPEGWARYARRSWKEEQGRLVPRYDVNLMRNLADSDPGKPTPALWPQFDTLAHAPLMIVRGELSDLLSRGTAEAMVARHPDARLHEVPCEGHAPLLEDAPTITAISAFVAACG